MEIYKNRMIINVRVYFSAGSSRNSIKMFRRKNERHVKRELRGKGQNKSWSIVRKVSCRAYPGDSGVSGT